MPDDPYSLADLARLADVTPRTIRYYVSQGLLPSPSAAGPATRYTEGHLARIRLIKRLQRDHLPLAEIRARLGQLTDEEIQATLDAVSRLEPEPEIGADATLAFVRDLMARTQITPRVHDWRPGGPQAMTPRASMIEPSWEAAESPSLLRRAMASMPAATGPAPEPAPAASADSVMSAAAPAASSAPAPSSAPVPGRSTWERIPLSADVELHVRRPLDRTTNKRLEKLLEIARDLFRDGP